MCSCVTHEHITSDPLLQMEEFVEIGFVEGFGEGWMRETDVLEVLYSHFLGDGGCGLDYKLGGIWSEDVGAKEVVTLFVGKDFDKAGVIAAICLVAGIADKGEIRHFIGNAFFFKLFLCKANGCNFWISVDYIGNCGIVNA